MLLRLCGAGAFINTFFRSWRRTYAKLLMSVDAVPLSEA